ncbi:hypothetical protein DQ04_04711060 [Trypanosoma grayi]|uniref:hypothetical protein n=1 Tax=Trypanosoma grayi TaxID=71804 RepID=UPI0004F4584A|nr:hypothetical protein DQ04_04711060 [Trypanosoma grayi]KEG09753.1 hypothetical protein DQ04_04711060 [Trypanosoma grayi]
MGLLSNASIFALMVLPIILLAKGHHVEFRRLMALAAIISSCMIAELTLLASLDGPLLLLQHVAAVVAVPVIDCALMDFVLNNPQARKVLHVHDAGDDATAVVASLWAALDVALCRWFRWYRVIGGPAFDEANLCSAAEAFACLVGLLLAARRINGRGGRNGNNNYNNNSNNAVGGHSSKRAWMAVAAVRIVATAIGAVSGTPLLGHGLYIAALVVLQLSFLPTLDVGRKES